MTSYTQPKITSNFTKVKKDNSGRFNMVHAVLVDPSRSIKLTLWESFVSFLITFDQHLVECMTSSLG